MNFFRHLRRRVLLSRPGASAHHLLLRDRAAVFMLHRFHDRDGAGEGGNSPEALERLLTRLGDRDRALLSLQELVRRASAGEAVPAGAVVFTVDDGYRDFFETVLPVFERHSCPVTVFLTTGFIDRELWMWWDQLEVLLSEAPPVGSVVLPETGSRYAWSNDDGRRGVLSELVEDLQLMDSARRSRALDRLARRFGTTIPEDAPPRYRPMTWDQVRSAAGRGATFAPHTVSHPVLEYESDERIRSEIERSWARLREETDAAAPCFAYPNGRFDERAVSAVRAAGLSGALTCVQAYVRGGRGSRAAPSDPYRLPRFPMAADLADNLEVTSGAARLRW